ncbi:MAG TPA: pantoate--beta-alanine ligase [Anaeromyxobacteraceae bacterium]|nr:pantoate--beta-alanine ligase [Anaeromyxobacteraceae bacterium]
MPAPELIRDPSAWQARCLAERERGRRLALVPTMGFLHRGHLSLMREARARVGPSGLSLATIFVNPAQFGPGEDLARYPRDLDGDLAKCAAAGVDLVLAPERQDRIYPPGFQTWVEVTGLSQGLCGARRPGHFRGVATVVTKLLNLSRPHLALFGEKDWQQLCVVKALSRDLDLGVEIVGLPIVREPDGLALSSRNAYLSTGERAVALSLSRALFEARDRAAAGLRDSSALAALARRRLEEAGARVDYVQLVHPETLEPAARAVPGTRLLLAAFVGQTRLIDNLALP